MSTSKKQWQDESDTDEYDVTDSGSDTDEYNVTDSGSDTDEYNVTDHEGAHAAAAAPKKKRYTKKKVHKAHMQRFHGVPISELRTLCNNMGMSCKNADGSYLSRSDLIKRLNGQ